MLFDKDDVPFEYNPRKSAIHFNEAKFDRNYQWDSTGDTPLKRSSAGSVGDGDMYSSYNYQQPISCISDFPDEAITGKLQTRGTIFIYTDINQEKKQFNTIFGI